MNEVPHPIQLTSTRRLLIVRALSVDRVSISLAGVFLLSALLYLWTADTTVPLSLHAGSSDRYNLLATAFLHFRLSVGPAPSLLLHAADPYNPAVFSHLPPPATDSAAVNDDALYNGKLYFVWGPAPALVLLVPLHLLGLEPSSGFTSFVYGTAGMAFALLALRVVIKHLSGDAPIWMCVLAGFAVSLTSVVPYLLSSSDVTTDTLAGGYCFAMAGIWLAMSAVAERKASLSRLMLMSLCFGLAVNSRPPLILAALILIVVYWSLRETRSRRSLLASLALPLCVCLILAVLRLQPGPLWQSAGNRHASPAGRR